MLALLCVVVSTVCAAELVLQGDARELGEWDAQAQTPAPTPLEDHPPPWIGRLAVQDILTAECFDKQEHEVAELCTKAPRGVVPGSEEQCSEVGKRDWYCPTVNAGFPSEKRMTCGNAGEGSDYSTEGLQGGGDDAEEGMCIWIDGNEGGTPGSNDKKVLAVCCFWDADY